MPDSTDQVFARLMQPPRTQMPRPQISLMTLVIIMTVAPVLIWWGYLTWPKEPVATPATPTARTRTPAPSMHWTERERLASTPFLSTQIVPIAVLVLASGVAAFCQARLVRRHGSLIATIALSGCGAVLVVAGAVWLVDGFGSALAPEPRAFFLVYTFSLLFGAGLGTAVGCAVAERS